MTELELFPDEGPDGRGGGGDDGGSPGEGRGAVEENEAPLAARMRPRTLEEFEGQDHLLGQGRALRSMLEEDALSSMILWGPPGSGKTTLARILAHRSDASFVSLSAVSDGIARVREVVAEARTRLRATGRRTLLFCDEIHRFNKAQQDAFLPHVEAGTVILVGATTENPSFEVIRPLLSRAPVLVLEPLPEDSLVRILRRALEEPERGLGRWGLECDTKALELLARGADGDARRALGALEAAAAVLGEGGRITVEVAEEALQHRFSAYDKTGEEHYNLISALHKSIRGSDPDAALYWLARMLEGGEDPLYLARRLVRIASEDVGMADSEALRIAVAARDAYHFLGSPEGDLALAHATVHLATAPKSNRLYRAWGRALEKARESPAAPVPLHIRNAPTDLMKDLGYGREYRYDPEEPEGIAAQSYWPEKVDEERIYRPGSRGGEAEISRRLKEWKERRAEAARREWKESREEKGPPPPS